MSLRDSIFHEPFAKSRDLLFPFADIHDPAFFCFAECEFFLLHLAAEHFQFFHGRAQPLDLLITLLHRFGETCEIVLILRPQSGQFGFNIGDTRLMPVEFLLFALECGGSLCTILLELLFQPAASFAERFQLFGACA